ncbi:unnamed protein product [Mytilus coruscus]|uniref:Fibronectin type-III domain-containing protein n=1 Tax=Mytilus coruscus TaxID=42192 RepID=A0A6J7ZZ35_MYTCO|nr:unnamed protein product [Mytilus coruscus]
MLPGKPYLSLADTKVKENSFVLRWDEHKPLKSYEFYQVKYRQIPNGKWLIYDRDTSISVPSTRIHGLKPDTAYTFKVRITNSITSQEEQFSKESEVIKTKKSTTDFLLSRSELVQQNGPRIYMLPVREIEPARDKIHFTRKYTLGSGGKDDIKKTVLMVGSTGSGKSTLINAMVNYILGVNWEDPCRFKLVHLDKNENNSLKSQANSQTEWITSYTIYNDVSSRIDFSVTLIDTPGFGDTKGLDQDSKIVSQIERLFTAANTSISIKTIDAVCFILKAPDARLTESQKYIFESILALFGNDMRENIYSLITFADGQIPPVLSSLAAFDGSPLPFNTYFTFNNSAFFVDNRNENNTFSKRFWDMGITSCEVFFRSLKEIKTANLSLTSNVLFTRTELNSTSNLLLNEIEFGFDKVRILKNVIEEFRECTKMMKDNENFHYTVQESRNKKIDISGQGIHTTTCLNCSFTCHENCSKSKDEEKRDCSVMDQNGKCTKCPNNCIWQDHSNTHFIFKKELISTRMTYESMLLSYRKAFIKRSSKARKLAETRNEMLQIKSNLLIQKEKIETNTNKLKEIALQPEIKSISPYIDLLKESELREKKPGFNQRLEQLQKAKKQILVRKLCTECISEFDSALQTANELLILDTSILHTDLN